MPHRRMDKQIVFEDDDIRVIFLKGHSRELVFSFGDLITKANGMSINAEKSLSKYDYNVIGVMPKRKSWFPAASMQAMLEQIQPILAQFDYVAGYGGSMGGYAAIKYSRLLGMNRVIAFVPQYSINPDEVNDRRYSEFFDADLNANMRIERSDIAPDSEYILVYDPYFEADHEHYSKIQPLIPQLYTIHLPFTGHDALAVLASSTLLNDFISHEWDQQYFYKQVREVKKNSKFYYRNVIAKFLPKHSAKLGKILKNGEFQLDGQYLDTQLKQLITRTLLTNKQVNEQDLLKLGIKVNMPHDQEQRSLLQDCHQAYLVFNLITQKLESYSQDAISLNNKYLISLQAKETGLLSVDLNNERYMVVMNDRRIMRLVKEQDALSPDMSPIVLKKYPDFYVLSYKNLNLSCDEYGNCHFSVEHVQNTEKFVVV